MKYFLLILVALLCIAGKTYAQDTTKVNKPILPDTTNIVPPDNQNVVNESSFMKNVIPPSPTSQAYDKYIKYDVSLYNGVPEISIPLYEVKVGAVTIPITINYHASGIKYGQSDGEIGVGWVLQPGYRVSRTIYGRPDELTVKPEIENLNNFSTKKDKDTYLSQFVRSGETDIPLGSAEFDGEYDIFTYSIAGASGSFIIDDRDNKTTKQESKSNVSIVYTKGTALSIDKFYIKDGNGVMYTTGAVENNLNSGYLPIPASTWVVEDVVDAFGNSAKLNYVSQQEVNVFVPATLTARSGNTNFVADCNLAAQATLQSNPPTPYNVQRLSEIITNELTISFQRNNYLNSITVKNKNNEIVREIVFHRSGNIHNFLDSIEIFGQQHVNTQVYSFDYLKKDDGVSLNNLIPDYWGFNKLVSQKANHAFPNFQYYALCNLPTMSTTNGADLNNYGLSRTDRNPSNSDHASYFTLKKVTYPTGGNTEYEYEPGKYIGFRDDSNVSGSKYAGIRVSRISSNDGLTNKTLIKDYKYGENENGIGQIASVDFADSKYFAQESAEFACLNTVTSSVDLAQVVSFSTNPNGELSAAFLNSSPIYYSKVTEYTRESETSSVYTNGKTEYLYELASQGDWTAYSLNSNYAGLAGLTTNTSSCSTDPNVNHSVTYYNYYVYKTKPWDKPLLLSKTVFKSAGSSFEQVLNETNTYETAGSESRFGLKVRRFFYNPSNQYSGFSYNYYGSGINSLFNYAPYEITFANKVLKESVTTTYNSSSSIEQKTKYYYNSDYQLAKTENWNSDGSVYTKTTKYPVDYGAITGTDNISQGVKKLQTSHVLNTSIEDVTEHNTGTNRLVNAVFKTFKTDRPLVDIVMAAESDSPIANFVHSSNVNGSVNRDTRYQNRVSFNAYDANGNLLEQQKINGSKEVFLWGYSKQYPVVKVTGSNLSTVQGFISQSILDNPATTDAAMQTELAKIRTGLVTSIAQVSTYTYRPLIGMTSETDPAGKTILYEYDNFGRLSAVKNASGATRATYCYNFAGQSVPCATLAPTGSIAASALVLIPNIGPSLPVKLVDFAVVKVESTALLTWSTSAESNSERFDIERSRNGKQWSSVGSVLAAAESSSEQQYTFTDNFADGKPTGEYLYRLKMVDLDGKFAHSSIKTVMFDKNGDPVLYPNPVTIGTQLNLQTDDFDKIRDIRIFDTAGKLIVKSAAKKQIDTRLFAPGLYIVQITFSDGSISTQRIVKQ